MSPGDALYNAKVTVRGEYDPHPVDEEQGESFPRCRKSSMVLEAIWAALVERKQAPMAEIAEGMEPAA